VADLPFSHREPLSPEEEKLGIEFYTAGKVDGGREALRRVRDALEAIQIVPGPLLGRRDGSSRLCPSSRYFVRSSGTGSPPGSSPSISL
jgi:hypothetical protein